MRLEENLEDYAQYMYANPVRADLVDDARLYGLSGGSYFDVILAGDLKVAPTTGEPNV